MGLPHFLYIEDHLASQKVMRLLLQDVLGDVNLSTFSDTKDFLAHLDALEKPAEIIFLDLGLSPLDGYAVCELLRQHPKYQHAFIVGLSASISPTDIKRMKALGFDSFILKPLSQDDFEGQMGHILAREAVWES